MSEVPNGSARILIVDDERAITRAVSKRLEHDGHEPVVANSAREALERLDAEAFDIVMTDIRMPEMSGIELLKTVKERDEEVQVIVMTGSFDIDYAVEAIRSRADDYLIKPFELSQLTHSVERALRHRALVRENRAYRESLEERVQEQARQIERLFLDGLGALAGAIEARDGYTGGHLDRVTEYALAVGTELELDPDTMWTLWLGSLFHDVGKLAIPDAVLNKPGPLTPEEYEIMKRHPALGVRIVQDVSFLKPATDAILHHQERWDGRGYPAGLAGEEICIEGRILSVVDAFDAMLTDRPYRKALSEEAAIEELRSCAGSQFDPKVVRAFLAAREKGFPVDFPTSPHPTLVQRPEIAPDLLGRARRLNGPDWAADLRSSGVVGSEEARARAQN